MTDTMLSRRFDGSLYELIWERLSGVADQWSMLFRLLPALGAQSWVFGAIGGTLRVGRGSLEARTFEEWPVNADAEGLRTRIGASDQFSWPIEARLGCEPLVWLLDDDVNVIDYDDADLFSFGSAAISRVADVQFSAPGLQPWRVHHGPMPLLSLEITFGVPELATSVILDVCSKCDLWRSTRLDGEPNSPHGEVNANLLRRTIEEVAAATGARIAQRPE